MERRFDFSQLNPEELQVLLRNDKILEAVYRKDIVTAAIVHFEYTLGYTYMGPLGQGTFGDVISFLTPDQLTPIAIKIVMNYNLQQYEQERWKELHHDNVQTLISIMDLNPIPATAFLMKMQEKCLDEQLEAADFKHSQDALRRVKVWIKQILEGLNYMHSRELCHLDLKSNNVLLTEDGEAVICDFSTLQSTNVPTKRYGVPARFRPPESFGRHWKMPVEGVPFDMWTVGTMVFNILTAHFTARKIRLVINWEEDIYPIIFQTLQEENLQNEVQSAFPGSDINAAEIQSMQNFICMFLRMNPAERPTAEEALHHKFLEEDGFLVEPDDIWINQASATDVKNLMKNYTTFEVNDADVIPNTLAIQSPADFGLNSCPIYFPATENEDSRTMVAAAESDKGAVSKKCIEVNVMDRVEEEIMEVVECLIQQTEDLIQIMENAEDVIEVIENAVNVIEDIERAENDIEVFEVTEHAEDVMEHTQNILHAVENTAEAIGEDHMNKSEISVNAQHSSVESENTTTDCSLTVPKKASKSLMTRIGHWVRKNICCCFRCCCRRPK